MTSMTPSPLPDDLPPTDRIIPTSPVGPGHNIIEQPGQSSFQSFMKPATEGGGPTGKVPSPFDLAQQQQALVTGKPTPDTLLAQIGSAQQSMGDLANQMSTPNLKLNRAQKYLLNNKLSDAKTHVRAAAMKLGVPETEVKEPKASAGPLGKLLGMLADGQDQLEGAKSQLENMKASGKELNPGDFLTMQVKLSKAQLEINYASILLSNAVSGVKQLFNIQI